MLVWLLPKAWDLRRALIIRVQLEGDVQAAEALEESKRRLCRASPEYEGEWDCLLVDGVSGPVLTVLPADELKQALVPSFNAWYFMTIRFHGQ